MPQAKCVASPMLNQEPENYGNTLIFPSFSAIILSASSLVSICSMVPFTSTSTPPSATPLSVTSRLLKNKWRSDNAIATLAHSNYVKRTTLASYTTSVLFTTNYWSHDNALLAVIVKTVTIVNKQMDSDKDDETCSIILQVSYFSCYDVGTATQTFYHLFWSHINYPTWKTWLQSFSYCALRRSILISII